MSITTHYRYRKGASGFGLPPDAGGPKPISYQFGRGRDLSAIGDKYNELKASGTDLGSPAWPGRRLSSRRARPQIRARTHLLEQRDRSAHGARRDSGIVPRSRWTGREPEHRRTRARIPDDG